MTLIVSVMIRCVNLDWLEVHCLEPSGSPHDADFFRSEGYIVEEREYGTRVYREMFTIEDEHGNPFIEVRRNPASQGLQGIHAAEECHLRLVNAACYYDDAALRMQAFIERWGYVFMRISRVDICMDFEYFDKGDEPAAFLRRYLKHRYAKINQGNITAHGADRWHGQEWNSVSWGSSSSAIGTKFYNKTMELYDAATGTYKKPHIRYAWLKAGLIDDFHKVLKHGKDGLYTPQIWRVEFSIKSSVKKWFTIELNGKERNYQSIRNTLDMYASREQLIVIYASLCQHYFHFKYYEEGKRKDRCADKVLFCFDGVQLTYKVGRDDVQSMLGDSRKAVRPFDSLIKKLRSFSTSHPSSEVLEACEVLIKTIEGDALRSDLRNPWSSVELFALRRALSVKSAGDNTDVQVLMREIKDLLKINDKTAIF